MAGENRQDSSVFGPGQSVNVVVSHGSWKWVLIGLAIFAAFMFLSSRTSGRDILQCVKDEGFKRQVIEAPVKF